MAQSQHQFVSRDSVSANSDNTSRLVVVSYNLHGLNHGCAGIKEMINVLNPDIIMIQEHWLFPSNMFKLNDISCEYLAFGSFPMLCCRCRPFLRQTLRRCGNID